MKGIWKILKQYAIFAISSSKKATHYKFSNLNRIDTPKPLTGQFELKKTYSFYIILWSLDANTHS